MMLGNLVLGLMGAPVVARPWWIDPAAAMQLDFAKRLYAADGKRISQYEAIDVARASVGTSFTSADLLREFGVGVPRTTDLGLLTEASKTNLFRYSDNMAGLSSSLNIVSRTVTDIIENTETGEHTVFDPVTIASGQAYAISLEFQPIGARNIRFGFLASVTGGTSTRTTFSGSTGLPLEPTLYTATSAKLLADGWIRITATMPATTASGAQNLFIQPADGVAYSYAGDSASGLRVRRVQIEAGSASSPIHTTGNAAVRSADDALMLLPAGTYDIDLTYSDGSVVNNPAEVVGGAGWAIPNAGKYLSMLTARVAS